MMNSIIEIITFIVEKINSSYGAEILVSPFGFLAPMIIDLLLKFIKFDKRKKGNKTVTTSDDSGRIKATVTAKEDKNEEKELYFNKKQSSIVEDIYYENTKKYDRASIIICMSIMIYYCINIFFTNNVKIGILIFLYALFVFVIILRLLIGYRIKRGYYGANYGECKEILYYLTENNDKYDKNSGKKIFNEIDAQNKTEAKIPAYGELKY